jgi:hypothetical protein
MRKRTFAKSGGRQPAVVLVGRTFSVMCWKCTCTSVCETTGGLRPRSCVAVRMSAGEKRFFRCVNVHSPRAAGVSRGGRQTFCRTRSDIFSFGFAAAQPALTHGDRLLRSDYVSARTFASPTTAGLRQPLLVEARMLLQKCVSSRGNGYLHHGWLTPAAPGCRCGGRRGCAVRLTTGETVFERPAERERELTVRRVVIRRSSGGGFRRGGGQHARNLPGPPLRQVVP